MIISGVLFAWECIWQETVKGRMKMASAPNVEDDSTTEHCVLWRTWMSISYNEYEHFRPDW